MVKTPRAKRVQFVKICAICGKQKPRAKREKIRDNQFNPHHPRPKSTNKVSKNLYKPS